MLGLVPGIHVLTLCKFKVVDGRDTSASTRVFDALCPAMTIESLCACTKKKGSSPAQHHQSVERDRALAIGQRNHGIDVDAFDLITQIMRQPAERAKRGEHARFVAGWCSAI